MKHNRWSRGIAAVAVGVLLTASACGSDDELAELVPIEDGGDLAGATADDATDESGDAELDSGEAADTDEPTEADVSDGDDTAAADGDDQDAEGDSGAASGSADTGGQGEGSGGGGGGQGDRPQNQQGGGAVTDEDLEGSGPDNEMTESPPGLDEVLTAVTVASPCELYTAAELGRLVADLSDDAGLTADLPPGLLGAGDPVAFEVDSDQETSCGWFSEPQIWALEISWQAADGSFAGNLLGRGEAISGIGDQAALDGDTTGHVLTGDLLVSFSHLPPGHTATSADRDVLIALMRDTVDRLRG